MGISGNLQTMRLPDILQWASVARVTGILELERNKICKRIAFRDGRIVACSSDDPTHKLGQFLISRGVISTQTLRYALGQQKDSGKSVTVILQDMGVMSAEQVEQQIAAKALEMVYGLFDWEDAVFRFLTDAALDPYNIDVDLSVDEILLSGAQRHDELMRIRKAFHSSGIVMRRTDQPLPAEIRGGALLFQVLELLEQQRTIADILLHGRASEYQILKLLFDLYTRTLVEVVEEKPVDPNCPSVLDPRQGAQTAVAAESNDGDGDELEIISDLAELSREGAGDEVSPDTPADLDELIRRAARLMEQDDFEAALDGLNACYRARPDDAYLRRTIAEAESTYLERIQSVLLLPERVPLLDATPERLAQDDVHPMVLYVASVVDGETNIQSILWEAPMREFEVLRTMKQMHDRNWIRFGDDDADAVAAERETMEALRSPIRLEDDDPDLEPMLLDDVLPADDQPTI